MATGIMDDGGGDVHRLELADDSGGGPASSSKATLLSRSLSMVSAATYSAKKTAAQGMMDIALLTANANQLRYILEFRDDEATNFAVLLVLIVCSLVLQVNTRHGHRPEGTDNGGSQCPVASAVAFVLIHSSHTAHYDLSRYLGKYTIEFSPLVQL